MSRNPRDNVEERLSNKTGRLMVVPDADSAVGSAQGLFGDVAHPTLIRPFRSEVAVHEVVVNRRPASRLRAPSLAVVDRSDAPAE